ncbi:MAG: glycosyltransferase family 2 protein [bacterium]|nr:glycosyltransferase family 2 protein [bacterium]
MTKLIVQIPCFNEEENLLTTLNSIPKLINGIDEIEILVINDGSTDNSSEIARSFGASLIEIKQNKGLANAFRIGISEALSRGADIIVNTDADNQYCADDIEKLIAPILKKEADAVVGARDIMNIKEFSLLKKIFQKLGSAVLKYLSSTDVDDAPSGFRAFSRESALKINVFDNYTYTMETLIQAGAKGIKVVSVPIRVNPKLRESRLFNNIFSYIFKSIKTILRMFIVYRPFRFFATIASVSGIIGLILVLRFLYYFFNGFGNGHVQSLIFASVFLIASVQIFIIAIIGDLMSINRKLLEDIQIRLKKIELKK